MLVQEALKIQAVKGNMFGNCIWGTDLRDCTRQKCMQYRLWMKKDFRGERYISKGKYFEMIIDFDFTRRVVST